jgi:hypothetical protein
VRGGGYPRRESSRVSSSDCRLHLSLEFFASLAARKVRCWKPSSIVRALGSRHVMESGFERDGASVATLRRNVVRGEYLRRCQLVCRRRCCKSCRDSCCLELFPASFLQVGEFATSRVHVVPCAVHSELPVADCTSKWSARWRWRAWRSVSDLTSATCFHRNLSELFGRSAGMLTRDCSHLFRHRRWSMGRRGCRTPPPSPQTQTVASLLQEEHKIGVHLFFFFLPQVGLDWRRRRQWRIHIEFQFRANIRRRCSKKARR